MNTMIAVTTLDEFIIKNQEDFPFSEGELSRLLRDIGLAAKLVHREVTRAGLVKDILGNTGEINVQGEEVQKLDEYANRSFISALRLGGVCGGIASEENEDFIKVADESSQDSKYVVAIDPLDGSSNIDVNISVGTIFSIYRRLSFPDVDCSLRDFLQKGSAQVASGYVVYGSSTMLVYTTGSGVNGFTLDPSIGEFCLSHQNIQIPKQGTQYSVNQGNFVKFPEGVQNYITYCVSDDPATDRPYTLRYVGSMVADIHRTLLKGGIFMYPMTRSDPSGKIRLLYESNPLSFIVEQAGGRAIDGRERILDIQPEALHQRTPIFIGSEYMVNRLENFLNNIS